MITSTQATDSDLRLVSNTRPRRWPIAAAAIGGGVLVLVGVALPWFTLFAGLQSYSGVVGGNGYLLLGGGMLSLVSGAWFLQSGTLTLRWSIGLLGFALLTFASWLLLHLMATYRQLAADPLLVAALGPGLFVVVAGALVIFATLFLRYE